VRAAQDITGVAVAHFSRIRKANLGRFAIDQLMTILAGLDRKLEGTIKFYPPSCRGINVEALRHHWQSAGDQDRLSAVQLR
jgi:hypothetical protein